MKSSPTNGGWWEKFKEAVHGLPEPKTMAGDFKPRKPGVEPSEPWPRSAGPDLKFYMPNGTELNIEGLLDENKSLRAEVKTLRTQLLGAKANERKLAWRIEKFRKKWPAIHKEFFTNEGKTK